MKWLYVLAMAALSVFCASKLPRSNAPQVKHYDTVQPDLVVFKSIKDGSAISLADYFVSSNKTWAILVFGSKGCENCGLRMKEIRDFTSKDEFFRTEKGKLTGLVGVYCDPEESLSAVRQYRYKNKYSKLLWLDPRGSSFTKWFLPKDMEEFGVPVAVFVRRDGLVFWSVSNKAHWSMSDVLIKVKETVGSDNPTPSQTPIPIPTSTPTPISSPIIEPAKDFILLNKYGEFMLSSLWATRPHTVVTVFSELCTSCWDELKLWEEELVPYCSGRCNILAVENGIPEEEPMLERYARIRKLMDSKGYADIPLAMDPHPSDGEAWQYRYFDGYLTDTFPEWEGGFGTVIYNSDKKMVAGIKGASPKTIKNIIGD